MSENQDLKSGILSDEEVQRIHQKHHYSPKSSDPDPPVFACLRVRRSVMDKYRAFAKTANITTSELLRRAIGVIVRMDNPRMTNINREVYTKGYMDALEDLKIKADGMVPEHLRKRHREDPTG